MDFRNQLRTAAHHRAGKRVAITEKPKTIESLVQERVDQGWRISERRETDVVIERGEKIPHFSHILMTVLTIGLWGSIYAIQLFRGGLKRRRIEMLKGEVRERRLR